MFSIKDNCVFLRVTQKILDNCPTFDCGDYDLNDFFAHDVMAYENDLMGKTYCWVQEGDNRQIIAMITVANTGIQTTHLQSNPKRKLNKLIARNKHSRTYPAALIGRLGVNKNFQGPDFRIGAQVMDFAKEWFSDYSNKTGCRFLVVDAINTEHTIRYYERNGFKPLFPNIDQEKEFYGIPPEDNLRTRILYFDLL